MCTAGPAMSTAGAQAIRSACKYVWIKKNARRLEMRERFIFSRL